MISCPRQWPLFPERVNCVVLVGSGCVIGAFWWQVKEYPIYALTLHSYWPNCKMLDLYLHLDGPDSELNFFYLHSDDIYLKLCDLRAFSISGKRMVIFLDHWFLQQKKKQFSTKFGEVSPEPQSSNGIIKEVVPRERVIFLHPLNLNISIILLNKLVSVILTL